MGVATNYNLPSASTSLTMSASSASVGFCPRDRITVPSSFVVMVPDRGREGELERWIKKEGQRGSYIER